MGRGGMHHRDQRVLCRARALPPRRGGRQRLFGVPRHGAESATIVLLAFSAYASHLVGGPACFLCIEFSMKLRIFSQSNVSACFGRMSWQQHFALVIGRSGLWLGFKPFCAVHASVARTILTMTLGPLAMIRATKRCIDGSHTDSVRARLPLSLRRSEFRQA